MKKQIGFKTKGMNQDLSVSAFNPEFSFENMNLRLSTNENNTLMSWVNERGPQKITLIGDVVNISGTPIGVAVINHQIILFTHITDDTYSNPDYIYKITSTSNDSIFNVQILYNGNLKFNESSPLETLISYESENVQKVYWTDGVNQPRVINVNNNDNHIRSSNDSGDSQFDFIPILQLKEKVAVEKLLGAAGLFAPGVIQYAFTYYNLHGQESNIFYTTPLYYISYKDRGAGPDDKVENAFKITISNVDTHFDCLRIYSIQRTSINATPLCKRVQDIALKGISNNTVSFTDTGTVGDSLDPTELLYKGGEVISAKTMSQKDGTLFMGNIQIQRKSITELNIDFVQKCSLSNDTRRFKPTKVSSAPYIYYNQLTSKGGEDRDSNTTVPCAGFKVGDYYRCGIQFQHESGKWSEPIRIPAAQRDGILIDKLITGDRPQPNDNQSEITIPIIKGILKDTYNSTSSNLFKKLKDAGYKKVRPVVVFPDLIDREIICQGVINPTVYTENNQTEGGLYAQSSWFFRPYFTYGVMPTEQLVTLNMPASEGMLPYTQRNIANDTPEQGVSVFNPANIRRVEIEGDFKSDNKFQVNRNIRTLHSPDVEFDDQIQLLHFNDTSFSKVGHVYFDSTLSDIEIQTETSTVSQLGSGFVHKTFSHSSDEGLGAAGIISGLFYDDFIVDDDVDIGEDVHNITAYPKMKASAKWLIYPWQADGSLNNDINRPAEKGQSTAVLKKKVISNLRYASTTYYQQENTYSTFSTQPQFFSGEETSILKFIVDGKNRLYKGDIDTMLTPDNSDGKYFALDSLEIKTSSMGGVPIYSWEYSDAPTDFSSNNWLKTYSEQPGKNPGESTDFGLRYWYEDNQNQIWLPQTGSDRKDIGNLFIDLVIKKSPVRMKYKSTKHLLVQHNIFDTLEESNEGTLPIIEIRKETNDATRFGGTSNDALRENNWIPCGIPVSLDDTVISGTGDSAIEKLDFYYDYGDTYYQRYDCLKTYPYTREDVNQIVEIGSFMLETHINIDGRYDRNRGQQNNLNMSPLNFNLINPVYNQIDNFFTYKIQSEDYYNNNIYPNQITWSKTKQSNADIDMWNNVTLASILELDGNKGEITSLQRLNDQLICFQDSGISQILYNENTQISTTEGVPIEIANSGKVQGQRYLSNTIGCSNKWSIVTTPLGIYFIDSNDKSIYRLGGNLENISQQGGFNTWCKNNIPANNILWTPEEFNNFVGYYDKMNQDILYINRNTALAFSERLNTFTSFYNYGNAPFFCNLDDRGIWVSKDKTPNTESHYYLWRHQKGEYCKFFSDNTSPYWITIISNPEPQADKIFTNLEFRARVDGEGTINGKEIKVNVFDETFDETFYSTRDGSLKEKFLPFIPFDYIETWDEYQHGIANLDIKNGHADMVHHKENGEASLKRKFRIWRCDIPRDNYSLTEGKDIDEKRGIYRYSRKPLNRMRNPWLFIKLQKNAALEDKQLYRTELHDLVVTYFN